MVQKRRIEWLFFDVGGVIIDETRHEHQRLEIIKNAVRQFLPDLSYARIKKSSYRASSKPGNLTANIIKELLPPAKAEIAIERMKIIRSQLPPANNKVRPGAKKVLSKLSRKYKLGLLANQPEIIKKQLEAARLLEYFTFKKVSHDYEMSKPDPRLFKAIIKDSGAKFSHSAIIDDNIERSLVPAKKLGMTTVWYRLEPRKYPKKYVDYKISGLSELLKMF